MGIIDYHLNDLLRKKERIGCPKCTELARDVSELTHLLQDAKNWIDSIYIDKERAEVELEGTQIEVMKYKMLLDAKNSELISRTPPRHHTMYATPFNSYTKSSFDLEKQKPPRYKKVV
jgi:hypothetical protein